MKRLITALLLGIFICSNGLTQDISDSTCIQKARLKYNDVNTFFGRTTIYPSSALMADIEGNVLIGFLISKDGDIQNIKVINNPDQQLTLAVLTTLDMTTGKWIPCSCDSVPIDKEYLASIKFTTSTTFSDLKKRALKYFENGDDEKALRLINKALEIDEYDIELLKMRTSINKNLKNSDSLTADLNKIDEINDKLLVSVWLTVMKQVRVIRY